MLKCPHCKRDMMRKTGKPNVVDSRPCPRGIRRRRICQRCRKPFTTYEAVKHKGDSKEIAKLASDLLRGWSGDLKRLIVKKLERV